MVGILAGWFMESFEELHEPILGLNTSMLTHKFDSDRHRRIMDILTGGICYYMWMAHFSLAKELNIYFAMISGSISILKMVMLVRLIYILEIRYPRLHLKMELMCGPSVSHIMFDLL